MADMIENTLCYIEDLFEKYGAERTDFDQQRYAKFGLRPSFVRNGIYYRAEPVNFEGKDVIIITATENASYAAVGIQDNIAGFIADLPKEKLEREVRFAFGLEPYPENYPDY